MAADESGKLDAKKLLSDILTKLNALDEKVTALSTELGNEVEARRDLADQATETLTDYGNAIATVQQGLFAMLSMHIDITAPRRTHPDPDVAQEAKNHTEMAMTAQAEVAPALFESLYGISAETGEELAGREVAGSLDRA